ncbi:MAG TPA: MFS transporter [Verrucomicrobiae bacterium]|jgi:predicted MFS family arabinose efflux permease|nr:MFS transporter [Verrucomicrobiae bacterium]
MNRPSERSLLLLLASVQFVHVVDFMIMMPLGPQLMRDLNIGPGRFSALVAAYTISSAITGLVAAPFLDRFDRRKLLLFFFAGFTVGTLSCALAHNSAALLVARALSGAFGGLSTSLILAIVGDVVPAERRAAGLGIVMTAFSAAAALGVPMGLQLAEMYRWEMPFFMLAALAAVIWTMVWLRLPELTGHLKEGRAGAQHAFGLLMRDANAGWALLFMSMLVLGHFTIIPLLSTYLVFNTGFPEKYLFLAYFVGGALTVFSGPYIGKLADRLGRFRTLACLMVVACMVILALSHAGRTPMWLTLALVGGFFIFSSGRFVPGQAIMTLAVPASRRGAFMSLSGCARDLAAGVASTLGGWIVFRAPSGELMNFTWLGWVAVIASWLSVWIASFVRIDDTAPAVHALQPIADKTPELVGEP